MNTYCRICEAACALVVEGNEHRPDKQHPISRGFACAKGLRFADVANDPERMLMPRVHGASTSWEVALAHAARALRRTIADYGPHAVGIYFGNPLVYSVVGTVAVNLFARAIGTRNVYSSGSQDCNSKFVGSRIVYGSPWVHPFPDLERAELAVLFGTNPLVSQSSFVHLRGGSLAFDRMVARGGKLVFVDPRRSESAKRWGEHLAIRPGTDVWLLLGLLRRVVARGPARAGGLGPLVELAQAVSVDEARTGLAARDIDALAERIATVPTAFHASLGVNQGGYGTLCYVAIQALAHATGYAGMLFGPYAKLLHGLRLPGIAGATSRIGGFPSVLGTLPGAVLADEITTPGRDQIRALVVIAGDPVRSIPGSGQLERAIAGLDFVLAIDMFENATSRRADVLLPATSWLERGDIAALGALFQDHLELQVTGAVRPAPGEAREETAIVAALLRAMRAPWWSRVAVRGLERAARSLHVTRRTSWSPPARLVAALHRLPRPAPRFWSQELDVEARRLRSEPPPGDGLVLITRRRRLGHNSWLHGAGRRGAAEAAVWISTDDAARLGIAPGDRVRIRGQGGALELPAEVVPQVAPGTVVIPHGLPDANVNELIPSGAAAAEPASGQHRMTGISVEIEIVSKVAG